MSKSLHDLPSYSFGDSPELADELLRLVLNGSKTATCASYASYEQGGEPLPKAGDQYIITDGRGLEICIIENLSVDIRRFDEIDEVWAVMEGEGDLSLEYWQDSHKAFFEREGTYAPDMKLVCEYFKVTHFFRKDGAIAEFV
ncbi:ASCH domain-containing protein [Rhodobacteraceae bacterium RKSG542]|uniref:ASCH domain-containing protein n=1 Tax=Pseudovibrio flavus TaxID=2529854 RepID=UPI0012BD16ED|nr:ASCH domain-containing protein [Pseudovibrio flavus]MTI19369.1 ASCH domain-containing protein [Pseudovibrio flavus]